MFHTDTVSNPTIEELQQNDDFEIVAELSHRQIKDFVISHITGESKIISVYMIYQILMILTGTFFLTRSIVLTFEGNIYPFLFILAGLIFAFTILIIIHELLHGIALKLTGASRISFGGFLKKFIFYAEADRHVLNRRQFNLVALTPLVVVKLLSVAGILMYHEQSFVYFPILVMCAHSLFCAGDIVMLSFFYRFPGSEIFTYDSKAERKSYFYKKLHVE